jgi:hypothetical protein
MITLDSSFKTTITRAGFTMLMAISGALLSACGGSTSDDDSSALSEVSTEDVECDYSDITTNSQDSLTASSISEWTCSNTTRDLVATGIPDHDVG